AALGRTRRRFECQRPTHPSSQVLQDEILQLPHVAALILFDRGGKNGLAAIPTVPFVPAVDLLGRDATLDQQLSGLPKRCPPVEILTLPPDAPDRQGRHTGERRRLAPAEPRQSEVRKQQRTRYQREQVRVVERVIHQRRTQRQETEQERHCCRRACLAGSDT